MVVNVYVSAVTQDNISRHDLLAWVNCTLQSNLCKIEEMSTGAAYCQLTHLLFRDGINLKKVKWNSRNEMDHINNWKILGTAWKAIGIDKPLQVERLTKGKFQDNFEFLQWFYKFFKANFDGSDDYDPFAARGGEPLPASAKGPGTNRNGSNARVPPSRPIPSVVKKFSTGSAASGTVVTKVVEEKDAEISRLRAATQELTELCETLEKERDFYFGKLRRVEDLCNETSDNSQPDKERILSILYETVDDSNEYAVDEDEKNSIPVNIASRDIDDETF